MPEPLPRPTLEIGYYHPTETFLSRREHVSVMDTSKSVPGGDGRLVALFGPSQCGGATAEEAAESRQQAQLFIVALDLLAACNAVVESANANPEIFKHYTPGQMLAFDYARHAAALAEKEVKP